MRLEGGGALVLRGEAYVYGEVLPYRDLSLQLGERHLHGTGDVAVPHGAPAVHGEHLAGPRAMLDICLGVAGAGAVLDLEGVGGAALAETHLGGDDAGGAVYVDVGGAGAGATGKPGPVARALGKLAACGRTFSCLLFAVPEGNGNDLFLEAGVECPLVVGGYVCPPLLFCEVFEAD